MVDRKCVDIYGRTLAVVEVGSFNVGDILINERLTTRWPDGEEF